MRLSLPKISITITTRNEEKHIVDCLESIKKQTYPKNKIEVIVVDNNSTDKTKEIARKYTKLVFNKGPERSAQRNFGMLKKSSGTYLMYLDADMTLSPKVIERCVKKIQKDNKMVGLYISEIVTGDSYWSRVRRFERSFYDGTVIDCVRFIKATDFRAVKGFDTAMTGPEDWDLDKKIRQRGKTALIKTPIYHNESKFDLKKYVGKKSYYAKSFDTYINKWGADDQDIKKQFSPFYRYFRVFVENKKYVNLLNSPILAVGMFALRFFVGISFISNSLNSQKFIFKRK